MADATEQIHQISGADNIVELGVKDAATVLVGTGVAIQSDGFVDDMGDDSGVIFAGVVETGHVDEDEDTPGLIDNSSGADGAKKCRVRTSGRARFVATGTADATWVGKKVYASDNQTVALHATVTNHILVGVCVKFVSATEVEVVLMGLGSAGAAGASGSTYTQTYSTADRTIAAPTAVNPDAATASNPAAPSAYSAHVSGGTTVTSNAATDLDTTAAALATLVTEVTTYETAISALIVDVASIRTQVTALVADVLDLKQGQTAIIDDLQAAEIVE